jgi:hypothetical protein
MNKKKFLLLIALIVPALGNLFAQDGNYFKAKTRTYANEVFQNCMMYATDQYIPTYEEWMGRVEVKQADKAASQSFPLLSTVEIKGKCNTSLYGTTKKFSVEQFNPLKYFFDFYSKKELTYRIDNSNYIVIIHPSVK